jgi:TIR domain
MLNVFISYRRDDSAGHAGRLADSLEPLLGSGKIFRDIEDIHPGDDFVKAIEQNLQKANVILVVIGKDWLTAKDDLGQLRLKDPKDFVRLEIEIALKHKHQIIPVLVDNATMPKPNDLPESIAAIAYRQAMEISDIRWDDDIKRLHKVLAGTQPGGSHGQSVLSRWLNPKSTKFRMLGITSALALVAGLLFLLAKPYFFSPYFSGNWYFEGGDYLLIKQDGSHFEVEHIDPAMQTTYDKGEGIVKGRHLAFDLIPIYTTKYRYRGDLTLSWDNNSLKGDLLEVLSNETTAIELSRNNPVKK